MTKPQINRTCRFCKKGFTRTFRLQHFCSLKCRIVSNTKIAPGMHNADECWEWKGSKHIYGYGEFRWDNALYRTHRAMYEIYNGPIPNGKSVCHKCDNPACVNPSHLFLGTHKQNMEDMAKKERHGTSKLSRKDVLAIRHLLEKGFSQARIARMFSISPPSVWCIKERRYWKHV